MPEKRRRMSSFGFTQDSMPDTQLTISSSKGPGRYGRGRRRRLDNRPGRKWTWTRYPGVAQPVQYFTRTVYRPNFFSAAPGTGVGFALNFQLNNLVNASEFTSLYDQYCIKAIKIEFIPRCTEATPNNPNLIGNLWSVIDRDDSAAPASVDTLLQYQNLKRTQHTQVHTRYFVPSIRDTIYNTGTTMTYAEKKNQWIDAGTPDAEHYGIKIWSDGLPTGAPAISYDIVTKFYLAFKNVR